MDESTRVNSKAIFDQQRVRTDPSPSRHDEPTFEFYDRCANPVIGSVRDKLEEWFAHYPPGHDRQDLLGKFRDLDRRQFSSAAWELYIHESLRRQGFAVKPNPPLAGTTRRLDFLATKGSDRVYVECAVVTHSDDAAVRRGGVAALEAAIDASDVPDYWLDLEIDRHGTEPIPPDRFVAGLRDWIAVQDIDTLAAVAHRGPDGLPSYDWSEGGWLVNVWAIPRSPELRGREDIRPLGIMPGEESEKAPWVAMRAKAELKAEAYGVLDAPYVMAINAPDAWPRDMEALWGVYGPHAFEDGWQRDGFLFRPDGPTYPGVSGVLGSVALQPHSFARQWPTLYENPDATLVVPESVQWARVRVRDGRPEVMSGVEPPALFDVTGDWPGVPWP